MVSIVSFLCASRSKKKRKSQKPSSSSNDVVESRLMRRIRDCGISRKARAIKNRMISWRKLPQPHDDDDDQEKNLTAADDAVWRKTIIKGGRCRPLVFSGKIDYDSKGNPVSSPAPDHPHATIRMLIFEKN